MDTGDTAWVLASAALVLLMTPGLALFYGGMVRAKSVLNMMMMSFGALALISVLWVLYGYSVAFGNDVGGGLLGSPTEFFGLSKLIGTAGLDKGFAATHLVFTIPSLSSRVRSRTGPGSVPGWSSRASGPPSSTSRSPTGSSRSTARSPRRAAGSPTSCSRSTSPVA